MNEDKESTSEPSHSASGLFIHRPSDYFAP